MNGKAKSENQNSHYKSHQCNRHKDLTILMKNAKKDICNGCFATLKKSYFNIIAGMLLEQQYLHNVSRGLLDLNTILQRRLQQQELHLLNLTAEISEIKKNGRNHDAPTPKPPHQAVPAPAPIAPAGTPPDTEETHPDGHVAQAKATLSGVLHNNVKKVLKKLKRAHENNKF